VWRIFSEADDRLRALWVDDDDLGRIGDADEKQYRLRR